MNNIFYTIVIVIISYLLLIFISPNLSDNIWDKLWIKYLNQDIRNFKSGLDFFSTDDKWWNVVEKVTEFQSWVIEVRDTITNKLTETKKDIDTTRKAVDDTNKNIQKTQESINATLESIDQVQTSIKKVAE